MLVFGMPSGPLSQPWPVLAGSLLSMWVGVASAVLVPDGAWAGALAVAVSVAVMLPLRCLHPPGAALALSMVLNPQQAAQLHGWTVPVTLLALLAVGMLYSNLTGRRYPHAQSAPEVAPRGPGAFTSADLDAALSHYNGVLDVSRVPIWRGLLHLAGRAAFARTLGDLRCEDIMSQPALSVEAAVSLKDAQALMRGERVKALPVVDDQRQVCGIVTVADFMCLARTDAPEGLGQRLRSLVRGRSTQPTLVGQIMSQPVQTAQTGQLVMELVPLFTRRAPPYSDPGRSPTPGGHRHPDGSGARPGGRRYRATGVISAGLGAGGRSARYNVRAHAQRLACPLTPSPPAFFPTCAPGAATPTAPPAQCRAPRGSIAVVDIPPRRRQTQIPIDLFYG